MYRPLGRENGSMVRLSPEIEHADSLNVLAAQRRELALTITTDRPLRKPRTATHRRQLATLRAQATRQIGLQLGTQGRRAFRGRISVELRLSLPTGPRHDAGLPALVKPYVDLLNGPVVFDDARVDHLLVLRQPATDDRATAHVRCLPLSMFQSDYDRAFRRLSELSTIPDRQPRFRDGKPVDRIWGLDHFDRYEREIAAENERLLALINDLDCEEAEHLAEDPDGDVELDIPHDLAELADADVRASARRHLQGSVFHARGDELADQGFDARDRPGDSPAWLEKTLAQDLADVADLGDDAPGCFVLPAPLERTVAAGEPDWPKLVADLFAARAGKRPWLGASFGGPLALDIALRGTAGRNTDLDNAARQILRAFERAFAANNPHLNGYRIYRRPAAIDDVRVRVLPAIRLDLLSRAMNDAREL
jgi:hypothetical protein